MPLELYFIGGRVKVEVALAKGKQGGISARRCARSRIQREAERAMPVEAGRRWKKATLCEVPSGFFVVIF